MSTIINILWELEEVDTAKLTKYIRCLFQVILPEDNRRAFQLIEEACNLARQASQVSPPCSLGW